MNTLRKNIKKDYPAIADKYSVIKKQIKEQERLAGKEILRQGILKSRLEKEAKKQAKEAEIQNTKLQKEAKKQEQNTEKQETDTEISCGEYSKFYSTLTEPQKKEYREIIEYTIDSPTEYDFAFAFHKIFGKNYVATDAKNKVFYEFVDKLWSKTEGINIGLLFSTKFYDIYNAYQIDMHCEMLKCEKNTESYNHYNEKYKKCREISMKLKKTNDKTNISREFLGLCYNASFLDGFNTDKNVLPLKDGLLFDMKTLSVRERTIDDKFTYECPVSYICETDNLFDKVKADWVEKYFSDLFCGNKETIQCFIDCIKTTFSGQILRHLFICSGDGSNGKSLLFKMLGEIFSKSMDTLNEKVFIQTKSNSHLNTEIEKLDKIRCGFLSEIGEEDKLNEKVIKAVSGGDKMNLRTICKTDATIIPTTTLWLAVNIEPQFKTEKAIINRIVNFPFNNNFATDVEFETTALSNIAYIFSYIMKNGNIKHTISPSAEMIEKKRKYVDDNSTDYLKDYIHSNIIQNVVENGKRCDW